MRVPGSAGSMGIWLALGWHGHCASTRMTPSRHVSALRSRVHMSGADEKFIIGAFTYRGLIVGRTE